MDDEFSGPDFQAFVSLGETHVCALEIISVLADRAQLFNGIVQQQEFAVLGKERERLHKRVARHNESLRGASTGGDFEESRRADPRQHPQVHLATDALLQSSQSGFLIRGHAPKGVLLSLCLAD